MKRVLAVLLACVMVFGVSATVFAADSPSVETTTSDVELNLEDASVETDGITITAITEDMDGYEEAVEIYEAPSSIIVEVVGDTDADGVETVEYTLQYLFDISGESSDGSVVLSLPAISADTSVIVLHYVDGAWQQEEAVAGDGTLTIYADSFSPFAIYILSDEGTDDDTDDDTEDTEDTSDTTGESSMVLLITVLAVLAAAGAAVSCKKIRE